jgi:hypothetical protein
LQNYCSNFDLLIIFYNNNDVLQQLKALFYETRPTIRDAFKIDLNISDLFQNKAKYRLFLFINLSTNGIKKNSKIKDFGLVEGN